MEEEKSSNNICQACNGTGAITVEVDDDGEMMVSTTCMACNGSGHEE
jgi:DnaJ-class molecular chaperone